MRNILFVFISMLVVGFSPAVTRAQQAPIRVKCGGPNYTDSKGQLWKADYGYNEGTVGTTPRSIVGTADPALFQTFRMNNAASGLIYTFNVPNGVYHVNLYLSEHWAPEQVVGARVFNVKMQGVSVFTNLDVFAEAGADAALVKGSNITVSGGQATVELDNVVSSAQINAIEITPGASGPLLALNFRYPDGSVVAGTLSYTISSTLLSFQGSEPLINGQVSCALLANPSAIGISAQFTITATLSDNSGHVLWDLNIGMNPSQVNLATVQNSNLTVVVQKL